MAGGAKMIRCEICGEIKLPTAWGVCKDCFDTDQNMFDKVRSKIQFGEVVNMQELSERSNVDIIHIRRWVKIGRLDIKGG